VNDHIELAALHRPHDAETIRAAIHELRNRGFGDYQIAETTQLSVDYVRRLDLSALFGRQA
jgi:hypothetical protein